MYRLGIYRQVTDLEVNMTSIDLRETITKYMWEEFNKDLSIPLDVFKEWIVEEENPILGGYVIKADAVVLSREEWLELSIKANRLDKLIKEYEHGGDRKETKHT